MDTSLEIWRKQQKQKQILQRSIYQGFSLVNDPVHGLGQEVLNNSRVEPGPVKRCSVSHGSGQVVLKSHGSGQVTLARPNWYGMVSYGMVYRKLIQPVKSPGIQHQLAHLPCASGVPCWHSPLEGSSNDPSHTVSCATPKPFAESIGNDWEPSAGAGVQSVSTPD